MEFLHVVGGVTPIDMLYAILNLYVMHVCDA
jgi:hypothetical protein